MNSNNYTKEIILASNSSRRKDYLKILGFPFMIKTLKINENYPKHLKGKSIPNFLAKLKAEPFKKHIKNNQIVITADTIVWSKGICYGKPKSFEEARDMLKNLSGNIHQVITSVGFLTSSGYSSITSITEVTFRKIHEELIDHYIKHEKPFDKAGGYGIQDSIGVIAVSEIKGSYTNVVGLPVSEVYAELKRLE
ncbi:MAG: septum formation protein Maf [Flavobacteriaceae bacterium]|nr:septum formation protein Maf [Flavobacteriaceae bacterium]|tara:strand:+ start:6636 stop:7217 length:582 start_codon:yes stop_codon:yes gene_type:complete